MKVKNIVLNIVVITIIMFFIISSDSIALVSNSFEGLNELVEVSNKVYVQHKEPDENGYIYDTYLLTSEGEETTIYEVLNLRYTAGKQWTRDGLYIDDSTLKVVATSPEDYVEVKEGEEFFVRFYGIGDLYRGENGDEWHITSPIVFFNDNNVCVGNELSSTMSMSKVGVSFTVPQGATKMYVSNYCNQDITVQRKIVVASEEFKKIKEEQDKILNYVDNNYSQITEDPIIYQDLDKAYITFVNDDTTPEVDKFADLFINNNIPLCFATIAGNLPNYASNGTETRVDVALRVQEAGGEILAHNGPVITENTIEDDDFMYNYFVVQKQLLTRMGLNVNGIILAGGSGQIVGDSRSAKWASSLYSYSDLLGEKYETPFGVDSVYFHYRNNIGNYGNDMDKIKTQIDSVVKNKQWHVFYFHNTNEVSLETLQAVMDYINSIGTDKVEIVTYETMYEKFAVRESSVKSDSKIYYVSANGTSTDGTDINDPINLDILNTKKLKTGDTVLFKSGDEFFGTLNFKVYNTNNGVVTISNYGEGELPTISTYKYITGTWEEYSDNIYRIDISDTNHYTGYTSNETHAYNVGFMQDDAGTKYYNKKVSIDKLENNFDFYSDGKQYLYMYLDSGNPHEKIGNVKAVVRSNLMTIDSNMDIKNIRLKFTGGHAIEGGSSNLSNITIENCIIEDIGGSYLYSTDLSKDTRYGNGIEFYNSNVSNVTIKNNIIRNVYDVAFTIQGTSGSGTNVKVHDNIMVSNSQDSEIWESGSATGVVGYKYYNNISINQGRGWGYEARPDQYASAAILFWGYHIDNTDIEFTNNLMYNPRRIYFAAYQNDTNEFFKQADKIKSDDNIYYLGTDAKLFREEGNILDVSCLEEIYHKDTNSTFLLLEEVDDNIIQLATTSNEISTIRKLFEEEEIPDVINSFETTLTASKEILNPGDIFEVSVNLKNLEKIEKGLIALGGQLEYDEAILERISITGVNGWNIEGSFNEENFKFVTDNNQFVTEDSSVFTIKFKVKENVELPKQVTVKIKGISGSNTTLLSSDDAQIELNIQEAPIIEKITSETYKIEEDYISKIAPEVTVAVFKQNVTTEQDMVFLDKEGNILSDQDKIATGMTLQVGNTLKYTLVVTGDVDGNGDIDINDLAKIKLHYIEYELLTGASLKAADVDQDEEITVNDIAQIKLILIGLMTIA